MLNREEQSDHRILIAEDDDTDLLELLEISFNEMLALLMLKRFDEVIEKCQFLVDNINQSKHDRFEILVNLIQGQQYKREDIQVKL